MNTQSTTDEIRRRIIDGILEREGSSYTNDPADSGGETKWGITSKVARANGYNGQMQDLDRETAFTIYENLYWHKVKGDDLAAMSLDLAEEVADTAVNCGPATAVRFLQLALNTLNNQGKLYTEIMEDGIMGSATLEAIKGYKNARPEMAVLVKALDCLQGAHYIELARRREKDERFLYGWLAHRVD